ncbi:hypothetical protein P6166_04480 [Stenotrophomonas sp. HITSZ_GD]|uniref:hypothetical protein n=1 Tax=Stenotrophomonas sp. HITSZ_GD TaxID=3037248 RepID=UPI00240D3B74|nr:hypothetical protein [Stenotrophomonas sp. HITSZ_GD]MDG2524613.1 hypothetical protein [Stenotrophomonas sp. HITSZ_GD]
MNERDFIAAMSQDLPALPAPTGLEVSEYTSDGAILKGNQDLQLPDAERVGKAGVP